MRYYLKLLFLMLFFESLVFGQSAPLVLDGNSLTIEDVVSVAREGREVVFSKKTLERVAKSHELLLLGAKQGLAIYGLNRGVGLNKDKKVFIGESIDPEVLEISKEFNRNLILSHSTGIGLDMPEEAIRASMLVRLNGLLKGVSGGQPQIANLLKVFLNERIHPVMPARGSLGEADIAILAHIALAMIGEGDVVYKGVRMSSTQAFKEAGLQPFVPYAKDALSILSSNAYSVALASLTLYDTFSLLEQVNAIYAMSLEGLNGNIAPLLWEVQKVRPYCGQWDMAKNTRQILEGSYLWDIDENRALQDPLSFRTGTQVQGACLDVCRSLKKQLDISLNSSDDNPAVILDVSPLDISLSLERSYYIQMGDLKGAIIPSGNFESITWVVTIEELGIALSHLSHNSVLRMIHLVDSQLTQLSRFLAPDEKTIAYGTIQKSFLDLDTEIRSLANPVSMDFFPAAGGIEDHATNAALASKRLARMVDNLIYISAIELMHAAQAIDLRLQKSPDLELGIETKELFKEFRQTVPFLDKDRVLNLDIQNAYRFLENRMINNPSKHIIKSNVNL